MLATAGAANRLAMLALSAALGMGLAAILASGASQDVQGNVSGTQYAGISNWYLYVMDMGGGVSTSAEVFDPWLVSYIDVNWDSSSGGYVCDFNY